MAEPQRESRFEAPETPKNPSNKDVPPYDPSAAKATPEYSRENSPTLVALRTELTSLLEKGDTDNKRYRELALVVDILEQDPAKTFDTNNLNFHKLFDQWNSMSADVKDSITTAALEYITKQGFTETTGTPELVSSYVGWLPWFTVNGKFLDKDKQPITSPLRITVDAINDFQSLNLRLLQTKVWPEESIISQWVLPLWDAFLIVKNPNDVQARLGYVMRMENWVEVRSKVQMKSGGSDKPQLLTEEWIFELPWLSGRQPTFRGELITFLTPEWQIKK